jgi:hypothetical protein
VRFVGKSRLGFYPLPLSEAMRIRRFLLFPDQPSSALDPCVNVLFWTGSISFPTLLRYLARDIDNHMAHWKSHCADQRRYRSRLGSCRSRPARSLRMDRLARHSRRQS